jgi:hypothetical protein
MILFVADRAAPLGGSLLNRILGYQTLPKTQLQLPIPFAYGGSSGVHLPTDVQANLRELEGLIKAK